MNSLQQILELTPATRLDLADFLSALSGSLIAAAIAFALYTATYGRYNIGAGVQRMFLLGGPSITALLLAIQFLLPLSLGCSVRSRSSASVRPSRTLPKSAFCCC